MPELDLLDDVIELEVDGIVSFISLVYWGGIQGNINEQTDLMIILDGKADEDDVYTKEETDTLLDSKASASNLTNHIDDVNNPHSVTKAQVGLENVDNTSDLDKPISTATQSALINKSDATNLTNGSGSNSLKQIGATAFSTNSVAYGSSIAGSKAFNVTELKSDKQTFVFDSINGIEIGMQGNVYINDGNTDTNYMMFGNVQSIVGNEVKFDDTISWTGGLNLQDSYIWFTNEWNIGDVVIGNGAISEGYNTNATQIGSHSEGIDTIALGKYSHSEGRGSVAGGYCSHAEGRDTKTKGLYAFASGRASEGNGDYSFAAIQGKANGSNSLAIGTSVEANGEYSIAFGHGSIASGEESLSVGLGNTASAYGSISIGNHNTSSNIYSMAIGYENTSTGNSAFAVGKSNTTNGEGSMATGIGTTSSGYASSSFGTGTKASGSRAVAIGYNTEASATTSFSGGATSKANHESSFAFGTRANTSRNNQVVFGRDNEDDANALLIIGNGTNQNNKKNAFEVLSNGIKIGNTTLTEAQLQQLLNLI